MVAIGEKAPDFTAPCSNGDTFHLYDALKNGPVILYFYNKDFTEVCTEQAKRFRDLKAEIAPFQASVVGVSKDGADSQQAFVKQLTLGFPLISDPEKKLMKLFGVRSFLGIVDRVTFVIAQDGTVKARSKAMLNLDQHVDVSLAALRQMGPPASTPPAP